MRLNRAASKLCLAGILLKYSTAVRTPSVLNSSNVSTIQFRWSDIEPSPSFEFHPCFDGFQCARLEVPLDWNSTDPKSDRLALAIVKLPAKVHVTDPRYGGPILLNPGGPGGSGVSFALNVGKAIQKIVDAAYEGNSKSYVSSNENSKYFDIISFDPRAVGSTTPFHTCFNSNKDYIEWSVHTEGSLGTEELPFMQYWSRQLARSRGCVYDAEKNPTGSKIALFANTPSVVRDMVEIIERHGEWREIEALKEHLQPSFQMPMSSPDNENSSKHSRIRNQVRWVPGEEPLNYWGFSYGTVLGSTFVTLQPHRVKRVVLDGVDDSDDYYSGMWQTNLRDSDKVMDHFFVYCAAAGPKRCAFHTGSSPEDIRKRWDKMVKLILDQGGIPVAGNSKRGPDIIKLSDVMDLVRMALYQPLAYFEMLANLVAPLSEGNGAAFADRKHEIRPDFELDPTCNSIDPNRPECNIAGNPMSVSADSSSAVVCIDGAAESMVNVSVSEYKDYWARLRNMSEWQGNYWASIRVACRDWPARAKWKIPHPVGSNVTASSPILFVSNIRDNATPLHAGKKMASRFAGSSLLRVDIDGHCSFANPSLCAGKAIRHYFQTGLVPANGAKPCLPHVRPFLGTEGPNLEVLPPKVLRTKEEETLLEGLVQLSDQSQSHDDSEQESVLRRLFEAI